MPVISCSFSPLLPFPLSPSILLAMLALPRRGDQSSKTTEVTARQQRRGSSPKPRSSGRECRPSLVPSKEDTSHGDARAVTYVDSTEHDNRQPRHRPPPSFSPVVSLGVTPVPPPDVKDSSVLFSLSQYDSSPTIKLPFPSPFLISRFRPSSAFVYSPPLSQRSRLSRHRSFFSFFSSCAPFSALSSRSVHMKADHRNGMASSSSEEFPKAPPGTFLCMHLSSSPCSLPSLSIEDRSDDHRTNNRLHSSPTQSTPDSTTPTKRKSSASPVLTRQNSSLIWPRHLPEKKTDSSKHPGHSARLLSQSPQPHAVEGSQASASILSARLRGRKTSSPSGRRRPVSALRAKELGTPRKKIPTRCSSLSSPPGSSSSSPTTTSPSVLFRTVKSTPPLPSSPSDSPSGLFGPVLGVQFSPTILVPHTCSADERSTPHDCVGVAPRCMHDLCWIPAARAYAIGVYIHRDTLRQWKRLYAEGAANNQKADPQVTQHQVTGTSTSKEKDSRKHEEDHVALLFSPDVEKTLVFTFVNDKDPAHILRGFERALQSTAPRALGCEDRDVLLEEVSRLIRLIRRCPFKPSSSLAVSIVPSSSLDGGRNTAEEEQDARRRGLSGQKRRDCSGHTEDSDGRRHLPASTLVVMYKDGGDGKAMQRGEVEGTARYECLGVCKDVRFLSLALHALYLKGWETPDPRYTTIAQKFRHDAERDLLAYPRNTS